MNSYIIFYHSTRPPHPKFLLLVRERISIRVHAISGVAETALGILAYVAGYRWAAIGVGICCVFFHAPTAFNQTRGTFGMRGIMIPMYYGIVALHFYCGIRLLMTGGNILWLERTWIALQTYAMTRLFFSLLTLSKELRRVAYTASVAVAGFVLTPLVFGEIGPLLVAALPVVYLMAVLVIVRPHPGELEALYIEHERNSLIGNEMRQIWIQDEVGTSNHVSTVHQARDVFDHLDVQNAGVLRIEEVEPLMESWGASPQFVRSFIEHNAVTGVIDFETFHSTLWLEDRMQRVADEVELEMSLAAGADKAQLVFDHLDFEGNGSLDQLEIETLLLGWGMPSSQASVYIKKFGDQDGLISLETFRTRMAPIWEFAFHDLFADMPVVRKYLK